MVQNVAFLTMLLRPGVRKPGFKSQLCSLLTGSFSFSCSLYKKNFVLSFFFLSLYPSSSGRLTCSTDPSEPTDVDLEQQYHIASYLQSPISRYQLVISITMYYQYFNLSMSPVTYHYTFIYDNIIPLSPTRLQMIALSLIYSLSFQGWVILLPSNKLIYLHLAIFLLQLLSLLIFQLTSFLINLIHNYRVSILKHA